MSFPIHTWTDGHLALRARAYEARGYVELGPSTHAPIRWPRTTGADAIAIAAIVDPAVRANGTPGVLRRWHATLTDLERTGLRTVSEAYTENRAFWATFEAVAVFLDDVLVPAPPPATWNALLDQLARPVRNAGPSEDGPFAHFDNIQSYDELYRAQYTYLRDKRGADTLAPPEGRGGGTIPIPRTTNADVLQLATYWSDALAKVKHEMGYDGAVKQWQAGLVDVDALAKPGKPDDVYPKNNVFWRDVSHVATQVAISDEAPSKWDMVVGSVKDSVTRVPDAVEHVVEGAAQVVGKVAHEAGKGLLSGLGTPVLIGAGLLGLFIVSRSNRRDERRGDD